MTVNNDAHRRYHFAKRQFDDFNEVVIDLQRGKVDARRLVRYWRELLVNFVSAYKALKNIYVEIGNNAKANKIETELKSDAVLSYLFQSRNSESHVAEAVEGVPTRVGLSTPVGNINLFSGDNFNITFQGNVMIDQFGNHHALPDFSGKIESGRFQGTISRPGALKLSPPYLRLLPATNRGVNYPVPHFVNSDEKKAISAASYAREFLDRWHGDARGELGLK